MKSLWNVLVGVLAALWVPLRFILTPIRVPWAAYTHWLHTRWPAGSVEKLPVVRTDGTTNVPGLYIVGDLTGIPLLKFSADSGAKAVQGICADQKFAKERDQADADVLDLVIIGGGVSGMAAALEAEKQGLRYAILEGTQPFATIANFPKGKPIYTYPTAMVPEGDMRFTAQVKEPLLDELREQAQGIETRTAMVEKVVRRSHCLETVIRNEDSILSRRAIVAIGRSGNFRRLGVSGEDLDKVGNRLYDPKDYADKRVLVVGGGDSAMETAIAIAQCGGHVDLSYRKASFSRPKPDNVEALQRLQKDPDAKRMPDTSPESDRVTSASGSYLERHRRPGSVHLHMKSTVTAIEPEQVTIQGESGEVTLPNDAVLTMIGREAPLDFFRRSGVKIHGETRGFEWLPIAGFFLLIWFIYAWKNGSPLGDTLGAFFFDAFPENMNAVIASWGEGWRAQVEDRTTILGTLAVSMKSRSFYYTLLYTICIGWFGVRRVLRRRTPYVTVQTTVLFLVQLIPLFLLPELLLPWLGYNGHLPVGGWADNLFEVYGSTEAYRAEAWPDWGHPRAYWRSYGFILAFPLSIYNAITITPNAAWYTTTWLHICAVQTFLIIPLLVWKWGKGAYCGWICSCGGLAETMGDAHRQKMFHGPRANRLNMLGQVIMIVAFAILALRLWTWQYPDGDLAGWIGRLNRSENPGGGDQKVGFDYLVHGYPLGYKWAVDVLLGGILGVGLYFKYSGRLWCRFACPLAALMHIYARFSKFRIFADKKKCISCNACTTNCHMGIDVMNFANKGMPMEDPECVRCSACVQSCPTGVLQFGEIARDGSVRRTDRLEASPVLRQEREIATAVAETRPEST